MYLNSFTGVYVRCIAPSGGAKPLRLFAAVERPRSQGAHHAQRFAKQSQQTAIFTAEIGIQSRGVGALLIGRGPCRATPMWAGCKGQQLQHLGRSTDARVSLSGCQLGSPCKLSAGGQQRIPCCPAHVHAVILTLDLSRALAAPPRRLRFNSLQRIIRN